MNFRPEQPETVAARAVELLRSRFASEILSVDTCAGQTYVSIRRDKVVEVLRTLRDDPDLRYDLLTDLAGVDYLNQGKPERFCVVYHLHSMSKNEYLRVKAYVPEDDPSIDTVSPLFLSANWAEREAYDFYGIRFTGHPNLRRLELPETYVGYPLRKDYPLRGMGERNEFPRYVEREDTVR